MTGQRRFGWVRPGVALVGCVLLAGCAGGAHPVTSAAGSSSAASAAVVPWAPLAPTYATVPSRTVPARPGSAVARAAPPCRAGDLRARSWVGAGLGTTYLRITVRLAGQAPCRLEGHPTATLLDRVRVSLPDDGGAFTVRGFGSSPFCNGDAGSGPTPVRVASFAPQHSREARVVSAYAGLRAHARRTSAPRPDHPLEFTVTLTGRRDVVLDPCPDFTIEQYEMDRASSEDRYALNCAAVPTRDAQGRPYLPAGRPVTFAMRTKLLGDIASLKFGWTLEVPEQPGAGLVP